jgi:hypothetical protein
MMIIFVCAVVHWTSILKVTGSIPTVAKLTFQLARCGCTLRVTSQTSYSPEYTTSTHTKINTKNDTFYSEALQQYILCLRGCRIAIIIHT